jgi:hypothetical protein
MFQLRESNRATRRAANKAAQLLLLAPQPERNWAHMGRAAPLRPLLAELLQLRYGLSHEAYVGPHLGGLVQARIHLGLRV